MQREGRAQIAQAVRNSFTIAWLGNADKDRYLRDLAAYISDDAQGPTPTESASQLGSGLILGWERNHRARPGR
jgi:hypothetical protein